MTKRRIVIDTNVFASALMSPGGKPDKIYRMFLLGELSLVFNDYILSEYKSVFYRPHLRISQKDADIMVASILQYGENIQPPTSTSEMPDEDDRIFYDTAKYAGACLITGNLKHYPNEPHILSPAQFLELAY